MPQVAGREATHRALSLAELVDTLILVVHVQNNFQLLFLHQEANHHVKA